MSASHGLLIRVSRAKAEVPHYQISVPNGPQVADLAMRMTRRDSPLGRETAMGSMTW